MREMLLSEEVLVKDFLVMDSKALSSDLRKKQMVKEEAAAMEAGRSDLFLEAEKKKGVSGMYQCEKCGSKNVMCKT